MNDEVTPDFILKIGMKNGKIFTINWPEIPAIEETPESLEIFKRIERDVELFFNSATLEA